METSNNDVVVGVDGSPSSLDAAAHAAGEAALHGVGLQVVHVLNWPSAPLLSGAALAGSVTEALVDEAEGYVGEAVERARSAEPGIEVTGSVVQGEPLPVLGRLSRTATLMVVGSRGLGSFAGMLLGSVAVHLAAHARCPVLVLRGRPEPAGPVMVGVDGSPANRCAIDFAFAEASLRGADLMATHVWSEWSAPPVPPRDPSEAYARKPGELRDEEEALLSEALSGLGERYPDVRAERHVVRGRVRESLIDASKGARMLVVGARGLGGFTGMLLGSVSQAALHHAHCPVVVVPAEDGH
ncbi:nucleotide-binding universal stress UspA family protein [Streptomyces sp. Amel2xB2]|uniref:universal stress protein n=1 Tax=Streptomyces sp. Amel2xB2 TaxID=1305829 RepID=UPI000DB8F88E|nr:universal stress protein [Streptomyces sp. Amel2xB2]RAJ59985.1 nucleotide-binding universal stress UspA family protein [Streptomyces sp. Amel2xB2]